MNRDECERARRELIAGLRAAADFYEQDPAAYYDGLPINLTMYVWGNSADEVLAATARLPGWEMEEDARRLAVTRCFSEQLRLTFFAPWTKLRRCRRLQRGPAAERPQPGSAVLQDGRENAR